MFGMKDHFAQSRQLFEDQFEPDGEGFLYRRSQKGAPIRVTAEERTRFTSEYMRRTKRGMWITVALTMLILIGVFWWVYETNADFESGPMWAIVGFVVLLIFANTIWAWGAPARELARRTPVGKERSSAEVQRRFLEKTSYGHLAAVAFGGVVLPFTLRGDQDVFHGWDRIWLVFGGALVLVAAVQAFRKWRFEKQRSGLW